MFRFRRLAYIALRGFPEVVIGTKIVEGKLRIFMGDEGFIDVWFSEKRKGVYAYHLSPLGSSCTPQSSA